AGCAQTSLIEDHRAQEESPADRPREQPGDGHGVDRIGLERRRGRRARLRARLEESEWTVVTVSGIASLRAHPLAALHVAGIGIPLDLRAASIPKTTDALANALRASRSALFLDDWDDLDESSWGVAESVRRRHGIPVVISRLHGLR